MSLCGTVVVVKKKRKRKRIRNCDSESDDSDDSSSPLSYTYTNCDSVALLNDSSQQPLLQQLGSDDESSSPPPFQWLNWRMDPIQTFSDWMIDVVVVQQRRRNTSTSSASSVFSQRYHVHKNVLVVESQLFQNLFYKHQQPQDPLLVFTATQITLSNEYEANVFPTFLDYMYSPGSIWINQQNAITLLLLSNYFGMRRLNWLTKQFLKRHTLQNSDEATNVSKAILTAKFDRPLSVSPHPPVSTLLARDTSSCSFYTLNHLYPREPKIDKDREPVSNVSSQASRVVAHDYRYTDSDLRMVISKNQRHLRGSIMQGNSISKIINS